MAEKRTSVGVIVGRFQVPNIGRGHDYVVTEVMKKHEEVCIVLGCSEAQLTQNNPLPDEVRALMLSNKYQPIINDRGLCERNGYLCKDLTILSLNDAPTDGAWSNDLDCLLGDIFPNENITLYGSRDSFASHYLGKHQVERLKHIHLQTGTQSRTGAATTIIDSPDFRSGIIYAAYHRWARVYPTVDIVVVKPKERLALLGQKDIDGDKFRFIGGFADPDDESYEDAAVRELREEAGKDIKTQHPTSLGSARINDHRYRDIEDVIMTNFFKAEWISGEAMAADDISRTIWLPYEEVGPKLIDTHIPLGSIFNLLVRDAVVS